MKNSVHHIDHIIEFKSLINSALIDPLVLNSIADRSVEHDNGFYKIVLKERTVGNLGYRLHNWKAGASDSNIHSHRWDMEAIILHGGYVASDYKENQNGNKYFSHEFRPTDGNNYKLALTGYSYLDEYYNKHYQAGDKYKIFKGDIHKICKVDDVGAITGVISWGDEDINAKVFSKSIIEDFDSNQRKLTTGEVEFFLKRTIELF